MAFQLRPKRLQRNRRKRPFAALSAAFTAEFTTPNVALTFAVPVILKGIPQVLTDTGKLPTTATKTSATVITLAYTSPGSVTTVTTQQNDPGVRTSTGGYMPQGTFSAP